MRGGERPVPGDGLLHPAALLSVAVLVINDHWAKQAFGNWWTGKISDFAGLLFFPLLLQGMFELAAAGIGRPRPPSRAMIWGCGLATGIVFSAIQISPAAAEGYRVGLAALQWPAVALGASLRGAPMPPLTRVHLTPDPTDLIALPAIGAAIWLGLRRVARAEGAPSSGGP